MDELEMIEVEMLESKIGRLNLDKQHLADENEQLRSTVSGLETTHVHLEAGNQQLVEENELLRSNVSDLEKTNTDLQEELQALRAEKEENKKTVESLTNKLADLKEAFDSLTNDRIAVSSEVEAKKQETERLFLEFQELEKNYYENRIELQRLQKEKEELEKENEKWDGRIDRVTEDNTVIILSLLTRQSDLEVDLDKQTEIIKTFFQKALEMVRETARVMEEGDVDGGDFEVGVPEGLEPAVEVMVQSLAVELAAVKRAFKNCATNAEDMRRVQRLSRFGMERDEGW